MVRIQNVAHHKSFSVNLTILVQLLPYSPSFQLSFLQNLQEKRLTFRVYQLLSQRSLCCCSVMVNIQYVSRLCVFCGCLLQAHSILRDGLGRPFTHPSSLPMATTFPSGFQLRSVCGESLCCWEAAINSFTFYNKRVALKSTTDKVCDVLLVELI